MPGDLAHLENDHRCYRGEHCAERTREPGTTVPVAALINADRGLCLTDTARVRDAITDLPDLYYALGDEELAGGSFGGGERIARSASLPVPIDLHNQALQAGIDHELGCWAESVAEVCRIPWDTQAARDSRPAARVGRAATLLARFLPVLISLRNAEHLVWVDWSRRRVPMDRDGLDGALQLFDLHRCGRHAVGYAGEIRTMPTPCPDCGRTCLQHRDGADLVTSAYCRHTWSWDHYQDMCLGILAAA